ncbi:telomere repeats-binding bouquet formation protein 2 [Spea bombifrons]|uniref:telomere repeats-binding bouquet formation protein 2 n=1 Tax=Spea bombifrons TaxID=233779 RepID=UPI0023490959|nr:telomere repeats-binding bouquet formation protein 2 [Spea bombifrons]
MLPKKMFKGKTAWFSQSVDGELSGLWEAEGGIITTHHHAEYLFSSDASHCDTKRIHNSLEYVENMATVFHASYIQAKTRSSTEKSVFLGHFILPPESVQEEIKRKIGSFIWEQSNLLSAEQDSVEIKDHTLQVQDLNTSTRGVPCSKEKPCQLSECDIRSEHLGSVEADVDEMMYYTLQNYPVNNMLTGYVSIDEMEKFTGELLDFIPNGSEYLAFCVHDFCG